MLIKYSWFVCFLYKVLSNWKINVKILIKTYNIIKQIWKHQINFFYSTFKLNQNEKNKLALIECWDYDISIKNKSK
jgi:hypothetical protein